MESQLIFGECIEEMSKLPDKCIDMVMCDPPYKKTAHGWDKLIPFDLMWEQYNRICKPNAAIVLTAAQPFTTALINSNHAMFRYTMVWNKGKGSNPLLANKRPMISHEDIVVFYKETPLYNPQMTDGIPYKSPRTGGNRTNSIVGATKDKEGFRQNTKDTSKRFPLSVLDFSIHCGSKLHPSQKPHLLFQWLIKTYTDEGMVVLDNYAGSGTTAIACINTNRKYIVIENDEKYYNIAKKRIEETCPLIYETI